MRIPPAKNKTNMAKANWKDHLICSISVILLFAFGFYFIDSIVYSLPKNKIAFEWETKIPFYPFAFIPYFGIFALPAAIPFCIKDKAKLYQLTFRLLFSIVVAAIAFICYPCELSYPQRDISKVMEEFTKLVAGKYNLVPSLHVCLTYIICFSLFNQCQRVGKTLIIATTVILPLSTLFSHQHHVIDVLTGLILGILSVKLIH